MRCQWLAWCVCAAVSWYVVSALVGVCLLCVVAGTTVCVYRCYRRRRRGSTSTSGSVPAPGLTTSSDLAASPVNLKHASVQHSHGQPAVKSADQNGDLFMHGPTCMVTGDHGVVCQVASPASFSRRETHKNLLLLLGLLAS